MPSTRRFSPPWTVEDSNDARFIVRDKNRHALAYVYYELEPGRRTAANLLTKDEVRRIAVQHRQATGALPERCRSAAEGGSISAVRLL
jgi:hypothetical protein